MLLVSILLLLLVDSAAGFFNQWRPTRSIYRSGASSLIAVDFVSGFITESVVEAKGLKLLTVEVPDEVVESYTTPGQYVQMKIGENKAGFYAIASPPFGDASGSKTMKFLIKETEKNEYLTSSEASTKVDISVAQGKGFQIETNFDSYKFDFPTMRVLCLACGSGIAPIAAAIDSGKLQLGEVGFNSLFARQGVIYIGAQTEAHLPFKDKYKEWAKKGMNVVPVLSKPDVSWKGKTGYVQNALEEDTIEVPRNTGVLMCGHKGMVDDSKELLLKAGVFEGRLLLNF